MPNGHGGISVYPLMEGGGAHDSDEEIARARRRSRITTLFPAPEALAAVYAL